MLISVSGTYRFHGEREARWREAGTVIADCPPEIALWLSATGRGRLWQGSLPHDLNRLQYLDTGRAHALQLEKNRRQTEALLRFAMANEETQNPET